MSTTSFVDTEINGRIPLVTINNTGKGGVIRVSTLHVPPGVNVYKNTVDILFAWSGNASIAFSVLSFDEDIHPHLGHRPILLSASKDVQLLHRKRSITNRIKKESGTGPFLTTLHLSPSKACFYIFYGISGCSLPFGIEVTHDCRVWKEGPSITSLTL